MAKTISTTAKLLLIITIIIILTLGVWKTSKYFGSPTVENMESSGGITGQITAPFQSLIDLFNPDSDRNLKHRFDHIDNGLQSIGDGLKYEFIAIGNALKYVGTDTANMMETGFKYVPPFIGSALKGETDNIYNMLDETNRSLGGFLKKTPMVFDPYLVDPVNHDGVFDRLYRYTRMYVLCGSKFSQNLLYCLLYYLLDIAMEIVKLIMVVIPIFLVEAFSGFDITCYYEMAFAAIVCIDETCYAMTGFHCFFYSDYILEKCYYCEGIPHKARYDDPLALPPVQPIYESPDLPKPLLDAKADLENTYNNLIPNQMKAIGQFLKNEIDGTVPMDPAFRINADNMQHGFGRAVDVAADHFKNVIPKGFDKAADEFSSVSSEFDAAFA